MGFGDDGYQVEVSAHQPILKGGVHRYLEGQARPHLQETKPVELRDSVRINQAFI